MKAKKILAFLCTSAVLISFSGCGEKNDISIATSTNVTTTTSINTKNENTTTVTTTPAPTESNVSASEPEIPALSADSVDNLADIVEKDVGDTIAVLNSEYEQLKAELNTFDIYLANADKMEAFYEKVNVTNRNLCIRMYEYSLNYAEIIINSDMTFDDKYDELDNLLDDVYDDAGDEILDGIYDGILEDMLDDYYDGIIENGQDTVEYSTWYHARSDEYEWWYDTRSDVYEDWYDFRGDVYEFWSDLRGEMWDDDQEKALEKIEDFRKDIEKMKD
ncbi:MAG: hypothetical protein IJD85_08525 [Oscillospiraceae bacterium]|nr:hypothetical protein [Oscillospiraceae bacterium]